MSSNPQFHLLYIWNTWIHLHICLWTMGMYACLCNIHIGLRYFIFISCRFNFLVPVYVCVPGGASKCILFWYSAHMFINLYSSIIVSTYNILVCLSYLYRKCTEYFTMIDIQLDPFHCGLDIVTFLTSNHFTVDYFFFFSLEQEFLRKHRTKANDPSIC